MALRITVLETRHGASLQNPAVLRVRSAIVAIASNPLIFSADKTKIILKYRFGCQFY